MYAQMVDTGVKAVRTAAEMSVEDRAFQARVDADIKIEPKDAMPDAYRKTLIRQISRFSSQLLLGSNSTPMTVASISAARSSA